MGAVAMIAFEKVRAATPWDTPRQQRHERLDQGLDTLVHLGDAVARAAVNLTGGDGYGVGLTPAAHWGHHRDHR